MEHELGQKRFDQVKKIVQVQKVLRPGRGFLGLVLQRLVNDAVRHMLASGCPDKLHFIFSHYGDKVSQHDQKTMFLQEVLYGSDDSVDTLHNLVGDSFVQKVCTELERREVWSGVCCKLLQASMSEDLVEVERCLAVEEVGSGYGICCPHFGEKFAIAAAQCGHKHVVKSLLQWQSRRNDRSVKWMVPWEQEEVLWIACRNGNVDLAVSMLWAMDIVLSRKPPRRRSERLLRPEVICTAKFLKEVVMVIMERLDNAGLKMNPRWFEQVLDDAIKFRKRHHVEALLDQVDPDRCGINFVDQPWLMPAVFRSRCASILGCILVRYREAAIDNAECDPVVVIKKYHWPTGARLLVEAGAKCKDSVPPEHAGILTISLEDRCRIFVRQCVRSPLLENVEKLPLPPVVKRHLLYQWRSEKS